MRLIDADKLIEHLNDYALQEAPFNGENKAVYDAIKQCIEAIEEQPTAYNIEKIVNQINEEKELSHADFGKYVNGISTMALDEAIEHARNVASEQKRRSEECTQTDDNCDKFLSCLKCAKEHEQLAEWIEQLKEYQRLEKQDRLIKLPCKIGDIVWINSFRPYAYTITAFSFGYCDGYIDRPVSSKEIIFYISSSNGRLLGKFAESEIGETVFLTKSEAESKLKELRGVE